MHVYTTADKDGFSTTGPMDFYTKAMNVCDRQRANGKERFVWIADFNIVTRRLVVLKKLYPSNDLQ